MDSMQYFIEQNIKKFKLDLMSKKNMMKWLKKSMKN